MDAAALLKQTLTPDQAAIDDAQRQLEEAANVNFQAYMHTLASELGNESQDVGIRQAGAIAFKNAISARDIANQPVLTQRWLALPENVTGQLTEAVLAVLSSPVGPVGSGAAQCVAAIAIVDLPAGRGQEYLGRLLAFAADQNNVKLRVHSLQSIGFICEGIEPMVIAARSNEILTAVVQGARKEEQSIEVQAAALQALYNSLEFIRDNFEREGERNYIMQVVCEATQSQNQRVQVLAYQSLVRIMSLYYDNMKFYMERALFGLTLNGMRSDDEQVALQAIEFWSTTCEEEIIRIQEAQEAEEYADAAPVLPLNFARTALPEIHPVLLHLLTTQDEDDTEDDWTRAMSAASCIQLLAQTVGEEIIPAVMPFIEAGIQREEWQRREAAVMAFGSILDGPDPSALATLVSQALGILINMLSSDSNAKVRDTVAWTLSKVTETVLENIDPDAHLDALVGALCSTIQSGKEPNVMSNCCAALGHIAEQLSSGDSSETSNLSRYFVAVMHALVPVTRLSTNDHNARSAAFSTISIYIAASANDSLETVRDVALEMLSRQEELLAVQDQLVGIDDRNNWTDIQINICVVLQSAIHRSVQLVEPNADRIMTNLLNLVQGSGKNTGIIEDAFATIGAVASALEGNFSKYIEAFMPFLRTAYSTIEDWQLAQAAVFATSDIARALGAGLTPHANDIMVSLVEVLRSSVVHRQVKPHAITAIGEIALAIGPAFIPYLDTTMGILSQAGQSVIASESDMQMEEFVASMRESILDAFVGILNGLRNGDASPFLQYLPGVMGFIHQCWQSECRTDQFIGSALGLVGDFGETYQGHAAEAIQQDWVRAMARDGRSKASSRKTRQNAQYAQHVLQQVLAT